MTIKHVPYPVIGDGFAAGRGAQLIVASHDVPMKDIKACALANGAVINSPLGPKFFLMYSEHLAAPPLEILINRRGGERVL